MNTPPNITPTIVDISVNNNINSDDSSPLRSCFRRSSTGGSSPATPLTAESRRRVRVNGDEPQVHLPPSQLVETLQNDEERRSIWYNGNDIRRMKQACVKVITKLDADQPVPQAVETDWVGGTTSIRGLEFGTRVGKQRKRSTLQFRQFVLQEQARLRQKQESSSSDVITTALAATAQEASQVSTHLAQELAIQDAAFVCDYVENVDDTYHSHGTIAASNFLQGRQPSAMIRWVRRWYRAIKLARYRAEQRQRQQTCTNKMCDDGRPRCDTESTFTIIVCPTWNTEENLV